MLTVRCTRELDPARGEGGLVLTWRAEPGGRVEAADSARTWVLDGQDRILVGPVVAPLDGVTGSFDISLRVPAGDDRAVRTQLEGAGARGRGVVADGEARGIAVPAAGTAEAHLRLRNVVPRLVPFDGQPGDLQITLRWSSVPGASGYRLYRRPSVGPEQIEEVADTVRVFEPSYSVGLRENSTAESWAGGAVKRRGRSRPDAGRQGDRAVGEVLHDPSLLDTTWFCVSAILHGPVDPAVSVASDSMAIVFGWIEGLPRVMAVVPTAGAAGVPDSAAVEITFDCPMDPSSLGNVSARSDTNHVTLRVDGSTDTTDLVGLAVDPSSWQDDGRRLRLQPVAPLRRDTRYLLRIATDLRDLDGRPLDQSRTEAGLQAFESRFDTEHYDPLRVTEAVPADSATGVATRPLIEVRLNRSARPATVNAQTVLLADSAGSAVACTVTLRQESLLRVTPGLPLRYGRRYQLTVTTGVRDLRGRDGESLDQDPERAGAQPFIASFRTLPQPSGPRVVAVTPADGAGSVPFGQVVRVRFSRPVQVASVTGNLTVRLPSHVALPGPFVASADRTEFTFTTTRFERGVVYSVVADSGGIDPQGIPMGIRDDLDIPFDQDSTVAGYQSFKSLFRVENCPRIVSVVPDRRSVDVPVDTPVTLRFSLPMARSSVTAANLGLSRRTAPLLLRPPEWTADSMQVLLRPVGSFSFCDTFAVFADTSLRSTRGSRFDQEPGQSGYQPLSVWFVTAADGHPPRVASWAPELDAADVPAETAVTVRFTKPVAPVTAAAATSFFLQKKLSPPLPLGPPLEATRTITSDSLDATLRPAVPLEDGAEYQVTVKKWVEDRCGQQLDQKPEDFGNQDFTSTFHVAVERVPPSVAFVDPALSAADVPLDANVEVTFTEPMGFEGTLTDAFSLSGPGGLVAGETVLSTDRMRLVFTPGAPLRNAVRFDVKVDTTATDLVGNHLDYRPELGGRQPFTSFFTTVPDRVPPRVVGSTPADGDTAVEVTVHPEVAFDKVMAPGPLPAALRLLDPEGATVLAPPAVAADHRSAILVPADSLRFSALYTLEVGAAALDTSGNGLDQDPVMPGSQPFRISFRTRTENVPPRVRDLVFDGGPPVPITSRIRVVFDEAIDPSTVSTQTVRLLLGGIDLGAAVSLSAPDTALVVPGVPLLFDTVYTVTVAGIGDLHGNLLDQDRGLPGTQSFTGTFPTVPDLVSPRITLVFPPPDSAGVDPGVVVEVRFSEPVVPATVVIPTFALYNTSGGGVVPGTISHSPGDTLFRYHPNAPFRRGGSFLVRVTNDVRDRAGNPLDQIPATTAPDPFESVFLTGTPPRASAGPGICDPPDSSRVSINASASADSAGSLTRAEIDWGDGSVQTIDLPEASWPAPRHTYACTDARGCNRLDDDGDGSVDETGADGCDESRRIILRVRDNGGLWSADTTGVSFCNLQVLSSTPAEGATGVDTLLTAIRLRLTRALDPSLPRPALFRLETVAGDSVNVVRSWEADSLTVALAPASQLRAGTLYLLRALPGIRSADGRVFDQVPCTPGLQPFVAQFQTQLRLLPLTPHLAPSPPPSAGSPAQEGRARSR
jgi:hypothetical protein